MRDSLALHHFECISESIWSINIVTLNLVQGLSALIESTFDVSSAVILNLFQDNISAHPVMLNQVQHDEFSEYVG